MIPELNIEIVEQRKKMIVIIVLSTSSVPFSVRTSRKKLLSPPASEIPLRVLLRTEREEERRDVTRSLTNAITLVRNV